MVQPLYCVGTLNSYTLVSLVHSMYVFVMSKTCAYVDGTFVPSTLRGRGCRAGRTKRDRFCLSTIVRKITTFLGETIRETILMQYITIRRTRSVYTDASSDSVFCLFCINLRSHLGLGTYGVRLFLSFEIKSTGVQTKCTLWRIKKKNVYFQFYDDADHWQKPIFF